MVPGCEPDPESRLAWTAGPVLGRISADLADLEVSVILTDTSANVLVRADGSRSIAARLDQVSLGPGYTYAEEAVGTNAIGTALALGLPAQINGREHFADVLARLSCAAAPITDPASDAVVGVLDLTSSVDDSSRLMLGLVRSGAREIEQSIAASMSSVSRTAPAAWKEWQLLTSTEQEVAELASSGLTNKESAATLYCSPYTIDSHLRAIYRKLGISSHAALASRVSRLKDATGGSGRGQALSEQIAAPQAPERRFSSRAVALGAAGWRTTRG
jgi:sigma-54 dependent transcriptional regulator, acetoin dehydrogenase operon transcriptional activator AcoR